MGRTSIMFLSVGLLGLFGCRLSGPSDDPGQRPLARGSNPVGPAEPAASTAPVEPEAAEPPTTTRPIAPPASISTYARLIPSTLPVVAGLDILRLRGTKLWTDVYPLLLQSQADNISLLEQCDLGPSTWRGALVGFMPDDSDPVFVLVAQGLGQPSALGCLATGLTKRNPGRAPWKEIEAGRVFELPDKDRLIVSDPDTIVLTAARHFETVDQQVRRGGRSVLDPDLQTALPRADLTRHAWVVGRIPPSTGTSPMAGTAGIPQDFTGWIDLSFGARIVASIGVENASAALSVKKAIEPQAKSFVSMLTGMGGPSVDPQNLHVGTIGSAVTFDLTLTPKDVDKLRELIVQQFMPITVPSTEQRKQSQPPQVP